jgi:hypothetical protein
VPSLDVGTPCRCGCPDVRGSCPLGLPKSGTAAAFPGYSFAPLINQSNILSAERLYNLRWLRIHLRVNFKHALLTYKTVTPHRLSCLSCILSAHATSRSLRSADHKLLPQHRVRTVTGSRAFSSSAPKLWNSLPSTIRASSSIHTLSSVNLKHICFSHLSI